MSKKITIDIPTWALETGQTLFVFIGQNEVARIAGPDYSEVRIKTVPCNRCGECCRNLNPETHFFKVVNGACEYLTQDGDKFECGCYRGRPFACCRDQAEAGEEFCKMEYRIDQL